MILDRVTVTGADDSIEPADLVPLSERFPFVEWGILLSRSQEGRPRFPSLAWIECLFSGLPELEPIPISGHLCGSWVRDFCRGGHTLATERPAFEHLFDRLQLNFHASIHEVDPAAFGAALRRASPRQGYIFQFDGVNDGLLRLALAAGVSAAPLFDLSGGAGRLPESWPAASQPYSGYAGGLSPENLCEQLERIATAAGEARVWIDVETRVRSRDDRQFDLALVERFLEIAEPWVSIPAEAGNANAD